MTFVFNVKASSQRSGKNLMSFKSLTHQKIMPIAETKNLILLESSMNKGFLLINPNGINKTGYSKKEYYNNKQRVILNWKLF